MLSPVKFTKVTKKYIKNKVNEYENIITPESRDILYNKTLEILSKENILLKDMKAITYWLGKGFIQIAFYTKDRYFTRDFEVYR
jgi:hypothetical protein